MAKCNYLDKKEWMRWHVTQSALLDERNMNMLERFYNSGPSSIKMAASRGPGGIQTSSGVIDYISPDFLYPKICDRFGRPVSVGHQASGEHLSAGLPSTVVPARVEDSRPPYRKRTSHGVYVGRHPREVVKIAAHATPWDPDTSVAGECENNHCKSTKARKGKKK